MAKKENPSHFKKGNRMSLKHTREQVLGILEDIYDGMLKYRSFNKKVKDSEIENGAGTETTITEDCKEGYKTLHDGLLANGLYDQKLQSWRDYTYRDDEEVTEAINIVQNLSKTVLRVRIENGDFQNGVAVLLAKSTLGLREETEEERDKKLKYEVTVRE